MSYTDRPIPSGSRWRMEDIIESCRDYIPDQWKHRPYHHPDLRHGTNILNEDDALDCYIGAYGEMHTAKCRALLSNIPYPPKNTGGVSSLALEIVDWGCGQGIGAMCAIDYLKDRGLMNWLKRVTLIEPSEAALSRATVNINRATRGAVMVNTIASRLPGRDKSPHSIHLHYSAPFVLHIFSNILDINDVDLARLAKLLECPGHTHFVLCAGPLNANAFRIERFCQIFNPQELFSDITSGNFGCTSDSNYHYSCKTKGFEYRGTPLDTSAYNPAETAAGSVYGEYDLRLAVQNGTMSLNKAKIYSILNRLLKQEDILYLDPEINGCRTDFIILRPNVGVLAIEVFEEDLNGLRPVENKDARPDTGAFATDFETADGRRVRTPFDALAFCQSNLLESSAGLTKAVIGSSRNLGLVKRVLICTGGSWQQAHELLGDEHYVMLYGREFIEFPEVSRKMFENLKFYYQSIEFDDVVLATLKRQLSNGWHSYREGIELALTSQQTQLAKSPSPHRKISGVAGSGKTQVMTTRAINAHKRTGGDVLLLTFNKTLINYLTMRLGQVRDDFSWSKIHVDSYHRFFKKNAHACHLHPYINSYDEPDFFDNVDGLPKYDAIFIDEVQDYKPEWLQLLQRYFLAEGGEFAVFGDPKQNIYERKLDSEGNVRVGVIPGPWNKTLDRSKRFSNKAFAQFASDFQKAFGLSSDNIQADNVPAKADVFNILNYIHFTPTTGIEQTAREILKMCTAFISHNNLDPKDVAIIAGEVDILREIDWLYRTGTPGASTTVTFVSKEDHLKFCDPSSPKALSFQVKRDYERLESVIKNAFTMETHSLKISSVQSFKGWEAPAVIFILLPTRSELHKKLISPELVYTAITRQREKLLVINAGNTTYNSFFKSHMNNGF